MSASEKGLSRSEIENAMHSTIEYPKALVFDL